MAGKRERILAALFYGLSSLLITVVNKYIFSLWQFPSSSVLALSQFTATPLLLLPMRYFGIIEFPEISLRTMYEVFPLPILYLCNTGFGLAGTKLLSIPMFGVLRRLTLLFTLILEKMLLSYEITPQVIAALTVMLTGSIIAASNDLAFDLTAYAVILGNDLFTALTGVVSKIKLNKPEKVNIHTDDEEKSLVTREPVSRTRGLGTWGLLFYNSLFSSPILFLLLLFMKPDDLTNAKDYEFWDQPAFICMFFLSTILGTILQFSIVYCTKVNSALTTSVTGTLKNMISTYLGMFAPGLDYTYSFMNFVGVNISLLGGVYYAWYKFSQKNAKR